MIRHLGAVEMYECSKCKERYVGPPEDRQTQAWIKSHRNNHTGLRTVNLDGS